MPYIIYTMLGSLDVPVVCWAPSFDLAQVGELLDRLSKPKKPLVNPLTGLDLALRTILSL